MKTNEITIKHLILCSSISDKWQKTLKTPNKVAGPVGKEGVLGGVNSLGVEMQEKAQKHNNLSQNELFPTRPKVSYIARWLG